MSATPSISEMMAETAKLLASMPMRFVLVEEAEQLLLTHYSNDSSSTAWLAEMRSMESEGERTPAQQPDIQIRADFERRGFCLVANGEPNGKLYTQYKRAVIDRAWVLAQLATGEA